MAFALILIPVMVYLLVSWADFQKKCVSTQAVITDISRHYNRNRDEYEHDVTVEYFIDGQRYTNSLNYYVSSMKPGQTVTVYYDPDDPYRTMDKPYLACVFIAVFVLIFGGVGGGLLFSEISFMMKINRLADEDKYVICGMDCQFLEVNSNVTVNHVRYLQTDIIYCDERGMEHKFSTRPYKPGNCPIYPGQPVKVYVDLENDPKKYYVYTDTDE